MDDSLAATGTSEWYNYSFYKTVAIDQEFNIDGRIFKNLLRVLLIEEYKGTHFTNHGYDFYFDKEFGLIALKFWNTRWNSNAQNTNEIQLEENYYDQHYDTLPLPMTRWYGN